MNFKLNKIWSGGDNQSYFRHRIPGMIVTDKGTVIVYNEARRTASDWALMDIFAQRSTDGGDSFGERIYLAHGSDRFNTVNNPVMMQDRNGRIHFLYCEDYSVGGGRVLYRTSDDDGISWSAERDITASTMPEYRNAFALGPGHGISTPDGTLLVPIWTVPKDRGAPPRQHFPSVISTLYSRDFGESWQLGEILGDIENISDPNETSACLLGDGRVYLNIRTRGFSHRGMAISANGYDNWTNYRADKRLIDPVCFGSTTHYADGKRPHTVIFANCENERDRKNVVVKATISDTENWEYRRVIDADHGGYVETYADAKNDTIYVLYEDNAGENVYLARFDYEWLTAAE